jgi:hypothetical protein
MYCFQLLKAFHNIFYIRILAKYTRIYDIDENLGQIPKKKTNLTSDYQTIPV